MSVLHYMQQWIDRRRAQDSLRRTVYLPELCDFCSNDYLGLARDAVLRERVVEAERQSLRIGSTGSRLLTGHSPLMDELEAMLADFHRGEAALLFNSGYDANLSLLSSLCRRRDLILYDSLIHASLHDGMRLSAAEHRAFAHNDLTELDAILTETQGRYDSVFIVVESVYSMDGDAAPLVEIADLAERFAAFLIVDEAHSTGIWGEQGEGMAVAMGVADRCFARLHTFGKAMGGHGAVVLGSSLLRTFLLNFARPLIYTTALPYPSLLHIREAYRRLQENAADWLPALRQKIAFFRQQMRELPAPLRLLPSESPIQSVVVGGNEATRALARQIQQAGYDVRPILSPTVPVGEERLRICIHGFNTEEEMRGLVGVLG